MRKGLLVLKQDGENTLYSGQTGQCGLASSEVLIHRKKKYRDKIEHSSCRGPNVRTAHQQYVAEE